ncbi:MAG TPA: glutathione-dependent formaldehyde dehydrogenase, partial [Acidimicrobiia bacterium]|nr:glutathione-dependent formaldehyde dehydrogenase [Acidimicrobiia bacterium]
MLPDPIAAKLTGKMGIDRLSVLYQAISAVRRGGTVSLSGVYGGAMDPLPMMELFDKHVQLRMGQANVRRWTDDILPLLHDEDDPLGTADMATHHLPLDEAPAAYAMFQKKQDGCIKVVLRP